MCSDCCRNQIAGDGLSRANMETRILISYRTCVLNFVVILKASCSASTL